VVFFSPLQCLFWYGKATDYDTASTDVEFFKYVPTTWDRSMAVAGEAGSYITMARRNKDTWFIGSITNTSARTWSVPLQFLGKGRKYTAVMFEDDGKGGIRKSTREVSASDSLQVTLAASGGQAVMIRPAD
jgi:alpha-glucosidase